MAETRKIPMKKSNKGPTYTPTEMLKFQTELLKLVDSAVDYSLQPYFTEEIKQLESHSDLMNNVALSVIEKSKNIEKCSGCEEAAFITNYCGHSFCQGHFKLLIDEGECLICKSQISYELRLKFIELRLDNKEPNMLCMKCKEGKIFMHSSENSCKHLCCNCLIKSIDDMEIECFYCGMPLLQNEELLNLKEECIGCRNERFYIGDYLNKFCFHEGVFCINCREEMLVAKKCKTCSRRLAKDEMLNLFQLTCDTCECCWKQFSKSYLRILFCCKKKVCMRCDEINQKRCCSNRQQ
jgi:hypothetical protein